MYGISYYFGLDVYDVGFCYVVVEVGMVFICELVIYILEEKIGICLENNILVIENGLCDLMKCILIEVEEIEEWMNIG